MFGDRNFILEDKEGNILAWANSLWIYMDLEKGRPTKPSKEDIAKYGSTEPLEREFAPRKIEVPVDGFSVAEPVKVMKYHIDTNAHVNNSRYIELACEALPEDFEVKKLRVEYKKAAVLGDRMVLKRVKEQNRIVAELCDEEGSTYAIVECIGE